MGRTRIGFCRARSVCFALFYFETMKLTPETKHVTTGFILLVLTAGLVTAQAQTPRERELIERIEQLEKRLADVESRLTNKTIAVDPAPATSEAPATATGVNTQPSPIQVDETDEMDRATLDFFRDTTFNVILDGYYGYNFNRPVGGINLLRAYDVSSNSFSLNQAAIIIENAPNLEKGKRYGLRLDLQYGQATETVQGNAANEPRPQVYRPVWQAYGTYIFDVGKGLTVDFGKFAGALGYETNYTKDNFNYSRAYFFNFLPFYHFGFRSSYAFNDKVTLTHWLVNGVQQSEDFNGFKSQALLLTWKPTPRITSQFNYYNGQEQRDRNPALNPTFAPVASQPGLSIDVIRPVPSGRFHVLDTYHTFNVTDKLTLAVEGDYVVGRVFRDSPPATVWGGVGYARYQWTPKFAVAGRFEYLSEKVSPAGGLFSGVNQALKEHTITAEYKFADGFLGRAEYRRDFSNQPFFLTERPGILKKEQNTATLGLVWWFGRKGGTW
jgi:Putative beta-barrel porin-2, OmpL-like. bbp2